MFQIYVIVNSNTGAMLTGNGPDELVKTGSFLAWPTSEGANDAYELLLRIGCINERDHVIRQVPWWKGKDWHKSPEWSK